LRTVQDNAFQEFLTPGFFSPFHLGEDERPGGAGLYTGGNVPIRTTVALESHLTLLLPSNDPEWADHNAHPTTQTFLPDLLDDTAILLLFQCPIDTDGNTGRILAMATLQRGLQITGRLHENPGARQRSFQQSSKQTLGLGMFHRTSQSTGLAPYATAHLNQDLFHILPFPLNTIFGIFQFW
tara:strand:+ start:108 stop:653 length:546 start_codon:yes stop_codon:yes gene_type:complete